MLMGMLSAAIVSPCVTAPLAGALLFMSQTRDAILGGTALFSMAIGMGVPLVLVGVSGGLVLPKSGHWMNAVKQFFGVLLLAVAILDHRAGNPGGGADVPLGDAAHRIRGIPGALEPWARARRDGTGYGRHSVSLPCLLASRRPSGRYRGREIRCGLFPAPFRIHRRKSRCGSKRSKRPIWTRV